MSDLNKHHVFVPLRLYRLAGEKLLVFAGKEKNLDSVAKVVMVFSGVPFAMAVVVGVYNVLRWAHYVP